MRKLITIITIPLFILLLGSCNQQKTTTANISGYEEYEDSEVVYVCTGGSAKRYHNAPDCRGLSRCQGDIEEMTIEEAEDDGKTPCKICY